MGVGGRLNASERYAIDWLRVDPATNPPATHRGDGTRNEDYFAFGEPFWLIQSYGVLGAFFMPFLAITLLLILNSDRVPREWRNKWFSNLLMAVTTAGL